MKEPRTTASIAGLREAADLLAEHPNLPVVYITAGSWGYTEVTWQFTIHGLNEAGQKAAAAEVVRTIGGKWDKEDLGETFTFNQDRGSLKLRVMVDREAVCERVVTGTTTVTIPAKPASPERTEEREVVEWRCEPLLADAARERSTADAQAASAAVGEGEYAGGAR